jgi:hypothetical protein
MCGHQELIATAYSEDALAVAGGRMWKR